MRAKEVLDEMGAEGWLPNAEVVKFSSEHKVISEHLLEHHPIVAHAVGDSTEIFSALPNQVKKHPWIATASAATAVALSVGISRKIISSSAQEEK